MDYVKSYRRLLTEEIKKATENEKNYNKYSESFDCICNSQKTNWNSKLKEKIEAELIKKCKLSPVCSICVVIENVYISPKGRSRYYDSKFFDQADIIEAFSKIQNQETFESKKRMERSKMSDSLRYDIFKRDNFRCTICGASQGDGVTLHVDHIIPVSKGGKTIKSNLRTLCSRCNLGKRDKYDPNGMN